MRIGWIGVGAMGYPMARNLLQKGFDLTVYSRRPEPGQALQREGAKLASGWPEVIRGMDAVVLMLPDSAAVEQVLIREHGLADLLGPGQIVIDMGTSFPGSTLKLAEIIQAKGAWMLDAPVSGGVKGAGAGTLAIMVGGAAEAFETCLPVFRALGKEVSHIGGNGAGHTMKLINNLISLTNLAVLAEVLPLAVKAGLKPEAVLATCAAGSGDSWVLRNHLPKVINRDFSPGFKLALAVKDLTLGLEMAAASDMALNLPEMAAIYYRQGMEAGLAEENNSCIFKLLEERYGVEIK